MDSKEFVRWFSIESFAHIRKKLLESKTKIGNVTYRAKIKLHGVNSGININLQHKTMSFQSRNQFVESGAFGFPQWGKENSAYFQELFSPQLIHDRSMFKDCKRVIIFGEWCGGNVQKGVALSLLPSKMFCVFSIQLDNNTLIIDPEMISQILYPGGTTASPPKDLYVIPWFVPSTGHHDGFFNIDFSAKDDALKPQLDLITSLVAEIDKEDPWVRDTFGVSGTGEGLVFYPQGVPFSEMEALMFKAKGQSHNNVGTHSQVTATVQTAKTPEEFAQMFVTKNRLEQGVTEVMEGQIVESSRSKFIEWVSQDVKKESELELSASNMFWFQVDPIVRRLAANFFDAEKSKEKSNNNNTKINPKLFAGIVFSFSEKFPSSSKSQLSKLIGDMGGQVQYMVAKNVVNYLIATPDEVSSNRSSKITAVTKNKDSKWDCKIISGQYITDCAEKGSLLPLQPYDLLFQQNAQKLKQSNQAETEESLGRSKANIPKPTVYNWKGTRPYFPETRFHILKTHVLHAMDFASNSNKFYVMELQQSLETVSEHDAESSVPPHPLYCILTHHGRTDELDGTSKKDIGTKECRFLDSLEEAEILYEFIMEEKLSADKGYKVVQLLSVSEKLGSSERHQSDENDNANAQKAEGTTLPPPVENLVKFLFEEANDALKEKTLAKITEKGIETPLGILALSQIEAGEACLRSIEELLQAEVPSDDPRYTSLSSVFFSLIPHKLGKTKQEVYKSLINTFSALEEKQELMQLMKDVISLYSQFSSHQLWSLLQLSDADRKYQLLKCDISLLDPSSKKYKEIEQKALDTGTAPADEVNRSKFKVVNIFVIKREIEQKKFAKHIANQRLLVHGSRSCNYVGLLSRGILLPKLVVTQALAKRTDFGFLGSGIYFSDNIYASLKYTSSVGRPTRFLLLANVALGTMKDYTQITPDLDKAPLGFNSCHAVGRSTDSTSQFINDEYVVYSTSQVRLDYLIEVLPN